MSNFLFCLFFIASFTNVVQAKEQNCIDCHSEQYSDWQQSDHYKAMSLANSKTVLGDFNNVTLSHFSQTAEFFTKNDDYFISLSNNNEKNTYKVAYTFGHYPLQQYLIETTAGRYQVFPYSWDSRPKELNGQRWFPNHPNEEIQSNDRLHWKQPLQNWNGMCADCHSDGLKRNYNEKLNTFNSTYDNVNVGCQSCHGKLSKNHGLPKATVKKEQKLPNNYWQLLPNRSVAKWKGKKRNNSFMNNCFSCHALRTPLTDGFDKNKHFLDQFSPTLLQAPFYHADGQIKHEVYIYGSFLQSKMYQAGVNCLDCHDAHTMKIKVKGNGLCLQCHSSQVYQQPAHLIHKTGSDGSLCVDCHMPNTRYMTVDDRRDHSLKIPRPELTIKYKTPNACNTCHQDKSPEWSLKQITAHYPRKNQLSENEKRYIELQAQQRLPLEQHKAIINDNTLTEIHRASAILLLPNSTERLSDEIIAPWVKSPLPLIRFATAQIGYLLTPKDRNKTYIKLLSDEFKAVRVQAAQHLLYLADTASAEFKLALGELMTANDITKWRGEGWLNESFIQLQLNQVQPSITSLKQAIKIEPYLESSYIALADIYRTLNEMDKEHSVLQKGIKANPKSGQLQYSYALSLIRALKHSKAIEFLEKAKNSSPNTMLFAYTYWLALDNLNNTQTALDLLMQELPNYGNDPQLIELGLFLAKKLNDDKSYQYLENLLP
ncbi:ammonia-forming cytochrome c nitrite reductase subunit c552 [Thalassotalea sp. 1_MG-2023]|uniref:ammonia-forming cytochrome c nitrite reductase subunit c552 n=1 Tax=Thalassotalea sp. 1_MG-2023 TaxID=3062680 RepID=UPI0026E28E3A|nr:ammonia-forming cytochrome c nitrite reductase subunit c552 [Thalassotalea sp. 1_MG-2023]MDO6426104.1 ammonia-forming cytochrome c nitrite reductase subunit c552 [Thalassotalea sp. 1_MG-2023]